MTEYLRRLTGGERQRLGQNGRQKILAQHTAAHRAAELESYL